LRQGDIRLAEPLASVLPRAGDSLGSGNGGAGVGVCGNECGNVTRRPAEGAGGGLYADARDGSNGLGRGGNGKVWCRWS
jgi:hypothetical protein